MRHHPVISPGHGDPNWDVCSFGADLWPSAGSAYLDITTAMLVIDVSPNFSPTVGLTNDGTCAVPYDSAHVDVPFALRMEDSSLKMSKAGSD